MERDALEREIKLEVGVGFRTPDFDGIWTGALAVDEPDLHLQAVYVDTPDLRLARSGFTLRHRSERSTPTAGEWTLKLPAAPEDDGPGIARRELSWPGKWGPVPAEPAGLVRASRRSLPLAPVARLVTHRRRTIIQLRSGERLLEIDDDVVSVMDGRKLAARFREVEVELVGPSTPGLLDAVVARLAAAGAVEGDSRSKLVRSIGPRASEPPDVTPVPVDRDATMGETVRAAIAAAYLRLVAHDPGIRLDEDPEDVHQARVATRRLRSDLRTFRALLPSDWNSETRGELGWLAEALGQARDADVLLERLHRQVESLESRDAKAAAGLLSRLVTQRDRARADLLVVLNSDRYGALLDRLVAAARALPDMEPPGDRAPSPSVDGLGATAGVVVAVEMAPEEAPVVPEEGPVVPEVAAALVEGTEPEFEGGPVASEPGSIPVALAAEPVFGVAVAVPVLPSGGPAPDGSGASAAAVAPSGLSSGQWGRSSGPRRDDRARKVAPNVVTGPWKHLAKAVADLGPEPEDEALHEVRIRAKRLRYASEAVAGVVGRPATALAKSAADLQGVLGDFHDAIVAAEWLRDATKGATIAQALAAGQLIAREREDAARCREEWQKAWDCLDRKKLRAWLR